MSFRTIKLSVSRENFRYFRTLMRSMGISKTTSGLFMPVRGVVGCEIIELEYKGRILRVMWVK